ncbi:hypothetical protein TNCV_3186721 [Trichonephila clavipes]|nr:hypothetical protein TNCV_3186721 [Trichonephila clavipes]
MAKPGSSFTPTPLGHEDNLEIRCCCSSLVVKVKFTDSWPVSHEFEPSAAEDPPCRGGRCTLNMSRFKRTFVEGKTDYNNDHREEIIDFVQSISGFQECDGDVETWMTSDADYTRAFGDGPRNFEPWSSDEDYT